MAGKGPSLIFYSREEQKTLAAFAKVRAQLSVEHQDHPLVSVSPWKKGSVVVCSCGKVSTIPLLVPFSRVTRTYSLAEERTAEEMENSNFYAPLMGPEGIILESGHRLDIPVTLGLTAKPPEEKINLSENEAKSIRFYLALYRKLPHNLWDFDVKAISLTEGLVWDVINITINNGIVSIDDETCHNLLVDLELQPFCGVVKAVTVALLNSNTSIPAPHATHFLVSVHRQKNKVLFLCSCGFTYRRRNFRLSPNLFVHFGTESASTSSMPNISTHGTPVGANPSNRNPVPGNALS